MAIRFILAKGIGFAPGSTKFLPTHGLTPAAPPAMRIRKTLAITGTRIYSRQVHERPNE